MREFKRNAALRYVMQNILIYQCPQCVIYIMNING